jgi:hypothetical protein
MRGFANVPLLFSIGLVVACTGANPPPTEPTQRQKVVDLPDASEPQVETAPTPFTADQIREGCKTGRTIVYLLERKGQAPVRRRTRFLDTDSEHATIETALLDAEDHVVGEPETKISSWEQLRNHAAFPKAQTTVSDSLAVTPAGDFSCKRYIVEETTADGKKQKSNYCFAKDLPGPPVEVEVELDGVLVLSMSLVKNDPGS